MYKYRVCFGTSFCANCIFFVIVSELSVSPDTFASPGMFILENVDESNVNLHCATKRPRNVSRPSLVPAAMQPFPFLLFLVVANVVLDVPRTNKVMTPPLDFGGFVLVRSSSGQRILQRFWAWNRREILVGSTRVPVVGRW